MILQLRGYGALRYQHNTGTGFRVSHLAIVSKPPPQNHVLPGKSNSDARIFPLRYIIRVPKNHFFSSYLIWYDSCALSPDLGRVGWRLVLR